MAAGRCGRLEGEHGRSVACMPGDLDSSGALRVDGACATRPAGAAAVREYPGCCGRRDAVRHGAGRARRVSGVRALLQSDYRRQRFRAVGNDGHAADGPRHRGRRERDRRRDDRRIPGRRRRPRRHPRIRRCRRARQCDPSEPFAGSGRWCRHPRMERDRDGETGSSATWRGPAAASRGTTRIRG